VAVTKEFRCPDHGDFEHVLPLCPVCKKISRRVFLTPPRIGSVRQQNINRALDDVLPAQNISNYTNATGYPKPTFNGVYQNSSGMMAGWGPDSLSKMIPGITRETPLSRLDLATGTRTNVDLSSFAAQLPKSISVTNGAKIGGAKMLRDRAVIEKRYRG
jgi:hypothetical protein